jgi:CheY-like chemotaxis protein
MTDEVLKKAYEPFFTTKEVGSGTGLGLSQVYGIAKQSNGGVRIDTELGKGTTVSIYLPRTWALPAHQQVEPGDRAQIRRHGACILVIDDDPDVRGLAVSSLETLGYRVLTAVSGRAALEMIASTTQFDLALIDMVMPEMDGTEVAAAIRDRRPGVPIVYMSGYTGPTSAAGLDRQQILKKPFTLAELSTKIEEGLTPSWERPENTNVFPLKPGSRN